MELKTNISSGLSLNWGDDALSMKATDNIRHFGLILMKKAWLK